MYILTEAIAGAWSTDAGAIRDAMAGTRDLYTVLGSFSFDDSGDAVYDPAVLVVRDGALVVFE
jgi:ABC-type branched-subunit amino acid transport system substrate-binding protein